jgi:hypothetical protein
MKTVKVFYDYSIGSFDPENRNCLPEDYFISPQKYTSDYDSRYQHSKCPGWKEYYKNTFTLYQQFPLKIKYNSNSNFLNADFNSQSNFDRYFQIHSDWNNGEFPEFQMLLSFLFWTEEEDLWIEQIPHSSLTSKGLDLISGTFPVSCWERPINIGVLLKKKDEEIFLDRGSPLCNVRFTKKNQHDIMIKLVKKEVSEEISKKVIQNNELKKWHPFHSWNLIKERTKRSENGKCPFSSLWKQT